MSQFIDLWRSHPMFKWGARRGLLIGYSAGLLSGVAIAAVVAFFARHA